MKLDLINGLNIEIGGVAGKHGAISLNNLTKLGKSLQNLVFTLARHTVESSIDLNNFELDLTGIKKCCTVLEIKYSPPKQQVLEDVEKQRLYVNDQLDSLIRLSDTADYLKLRDIYPDASRRNYIVKDFYEFATSLGTTPVRFFGYNKNNALVPIYKIRKFSPQIKDKLISQISAISDKTDSLETVGHILLTKVPGKKSPKRKIIDAYDTPGLCVAYNPSSLRHFEHKYVFNGNLMCELTKEDDNFFIKHPMLDIIGVGDTPMNAEIDFAEEFDFLYQRCNELPNNKLTDRLQRIKKLLNIYVKRVEE
jgi:hypothetical protein